MMPLGMSHSPKAAVVSDVTHTMICVTSFTEYMQLKLEKNCDTLIFRVNILGRGFVCAYMIFE